MTTKAFFVNILFVSLVLLIALACLAYYQYSDGYRYAKEQLVSHESSCKYLYGGVNPYWHYFEIIGCEVQVLDRLKNLESTLGINASDLSKEELRALMLQQQLLEYNQRRRVQDWIEHERCNDEVEECNGDMSRHYGYDAAPYTGQESHTPLSPEECEEVDNAGFLPECREL